MIDVERTLVNREKSKSKPERKKEGNQQAWEGKLYGVSMTAAVPTGDRMRGCTPTNGCLRLFPLTTRLETRMRGLYNWTIHIDIALRILEMPSWIHDSRVVSDVGTCTVELIKGKKKQISLTVMSGNRTIGLGAKHQSLYLHAHYTKWSIQRYKCGSMRKACSREGIRK